MSLLQDASITYLDDEMDNLVDTRDFLAEKGVTIHATSSVKDAKISALNKKCDILICDLNLDQDELPEKGSKILSQIREQNRDIFLVLYTAFKHQLNLKEIEFLRGNNILIYDKLDNDEFLLNLDKDYARFRSARAKSTVLSGKDNSDSEFETEISNNVKQLVLGHLRGISNQQLLVPVPKHQDITVAELINEVEKNSSIAKVFCLEWLNTIFMIKKIRKDI